MKKKLMTAIVSIGIFCMSFTSVYAQPMQLVYDGQTHYYDLEPITMYINGEKIDTNLMPPVQIESTTLVPVREIFEPMGAFVEWKAEEKKVYVDYNNTLIILEMNNKEVWKNGEVLQLDVPAKVINDKIMVPVRFISEQIGFHVEWKGDTREIFITNKQEVIPPDTNEPTPEEPSTPDEPTVPEEDDTEQKADATDLMMKLNGITNIYEGIQNKYKVSVINKSYDKTNVEAVNVTSSGNGAIGIIQASSPITNIDTFFSEGKIVVDVLNSNSGLKSSITPTTNEYVSGIRTSQFTADTTRVVFDLKSGVKAKTSLSTDRKSIIIEMEKQPLEVVVAGYDNAGDYIAIDNISPSQMQISQVPGKITVDINNVYVDKSINWNNVNGEYIDKIEINNTTKGIQLDITLTQTGTCTIQTLADKGDTIIRVVGSNFKNIGYYNKVITLTGATGLKANSIKVDDQYRERKLVIDLGADYSSHFGRGDYAVNDSTINKIQIVTEGTTKLIIDEVTIHAVNVRDTDGGVQIQLVKPTEKYQRILVLDPGHGGSDSGASANGLKEKEVNFKQAMAIKSLVENNTDIKVYLTREEDTTLTLAFRTDLANEIGADMFVSVHNNSATSAPSGTEVLYYPNDSDPRSRQMAQIMQENIIEATGMTNRGIKSRPDLYVLRTSKMPAVLLEGGFVTNTSDAAKLASEEFTQKYAYAVYESIVEIFNTMSFR